ncbi:MAG: phosphomannomutase/phosphoglucomutase [Wolbachia endosymbiont of Fragariocoptes setiger]|nr:phosphomannomutase/phosphoglucomutase [Wolbachia endosymbiont of Fragariocoptes setiger]
MDSNIIRKYDIRGIVGKELHISDGYEIGKKFGQFAINSCVGYDSRISGPAIEKELIRGIISSGGNVIRVGLCSSPMLYAATQTTKAEIGIMITASHNPKEYNGFKFFSNKQVFSNQEIKEVLNKTIEPSMKSGSVININLYHKYINILKNAVHNDNEERKLKIAWDCGNSPASGIIRYIEEVLPNHEHIVINNSIDGTFPLHDPDPIEEKNLVLLVNTIKEHTCDLGIALDGDSDRVCLIDNTGNIISNDHLFMLFAHETIEKHPNSKIIANVKMSMKVYDFVNKLGGQIITCATGHSLVKKKMIEENAKFAGELSGHFFFSELGFDDGLYSAIKAIDIVLRKKESLYTIIEALPKLYITHEIKIVVKEEKKFKIIEAIKTMLQKQNITFSSLDGIKVIDDRGWWLIRASNTQNCITARCEGKTPQDLEHIKEILFYYMNKAQSLND